MSLLAGLAQTKSNMVAKRMNFSKENVLYFWPNPYQIVKTAQILAFSKFKFEKLKISLNGDFFKSAERISFSTKLSTLTADGQ